jgi:hypothetical protein
MRDASTIKNYPNYDIKKYDTSHTFCLFSPNPDVSWAPICRRFGDNDVDRCCASVLRARNSTPILFIFPAIRHIAWCKPFGKGAREGEE